MTEKQKLFESQYDRDLQRANEQHYDKIYKPRDNHAIGQAETKGLSIDDGSLTEIEQLVFRINQLTEIIKEIDSMPIVRRINGRPF